eukprot:IDg16090t1
MCESRTFRRVIAAFAHTRFKQAIFTVYSNALRLQRHDFARSTAYREAPASLFLLILIVPYATREHIEIYIGAGLTYFNFCCFRPEFRASRERQTPLKCAADESRGETRTLMEGKAESLSREGTLRPSAFA